MNLAPHAPQQLRAIATRERVVHAAVRSLATGGLAASTTAAVAQAAGVSQGALFRHFPTKPALLAAALERILADLFDAAARALAALAPDDRALRDGLAALWTVFADDRLSGAFELFLAARTDPALQEAIAPVVERHVHAELALARALFPDADQNPRFDEIVLGVLSTLQGAAVAAGIRGNDAAAEPVELAFLHAVVERELGAPRPADLNIHTMPRTP